MNMRIVTGVVALAVGAAAISMAGPAAAVWRVVGPGMAVGDAREGGATLAAECRAGALVLGIYNLSWEHDHGEELDIVINGETFVLNQYRSGEETVFSDAAADATDRTISPALRTALKTGSEAQLAGPAVGHIAPREIAFGLVRSRGAIETVEKFCG